MRTSLGFLLFITLASSTFSIEITAEKLAKSLSSNVLKFKKDYEGKVVTVKGNSGIVKQSESDYILIISYKTVNFTDPVVWCVLDAESLDRAASLKEKASVTVKGTVERLDSTMGGYIIALQKCSIL